MLLAVAALSVIQREEGLEGTEMRVSGREETLSTLLPVGHNAHNDDTDQHAT